MINYKDTIYKVLVNLYGYESFYFVDDPNEKIDSILKNEEINWYPPYLVFCEDKFFMFTPFCYENFIDESEVKEECKNARHLVDCLKSEGKNSKVFFEKPYEAGQVDDIVRWLFTIKSSGISCAHEYYNP